MGQYKKTLIQQRQAKNQDKKLDKLLRIISRLVGPSTSADPEELAEKLKKTGIKLSAKEVEHYLKLFNVKVEYKKNRLLSHLSPKLNHEQSKVLEKSLSHAERKGYLWTITFLEDLVQKLRSRNFNAWLNAWLYALQEKQSTIPALLTKEKEDIYLRIPRKAAKLLSLKPGDLVQFKYVGDRIRMIAKLSEKEGAFRAYIKKQLTRYREYTSKEKKDTILLVSKPAKIYMFLEKAYKTSGSKSLLFLPTAIFEKIAYPIIVVEAIDSQGKSYVFMAKVHLRHEKHGKAYYIKTPLPSNKTYQIILHDLKTYILEKMPQRCTLKNLQTEIKDLTLLQQPLRLGKFTYTIGHAAIVIGQTMHPAYIEINLNKNTINLAIKSSVPDLHLKISYNPGQNIYTPFILQGTHKYKIYQIKEIETTTAQGIETAYILYGIRQYKNTTRQLNLIITPEEIAPLKDYLAKIAEITEYTTHIQPLRLQKIATKIQDLSQIDTIIANADYNLIKTLEYHREQKNTLEIGRIGEEIVGTLEYEIKKITSQVTGIPLDNIFIRHKGTKFHGKSSSDFEILTENNVIIGLLETSIGQKLDNILTRHLIPQIALRENSRQYSQAKIFMIIPIEYQPPSGFLRLSLLIKEKGDAIFKDYTSELYKEMAKRHGH